MRKVYRLSLFIFLFLVSISTFAQKTFFYDISESLVKKSQTRDVALPKKFRTVRLDNTLMRNFLWSLPSENVAIYNRISTPVLELPMPNGKSAKFKIWQSSIQEPGLEAKFPEIKTFSGQGIDDPYATIKIDYNPYSGFHAQILSAATGRIYIDPYTKGNIEDYISYFHNDNEKNRIFNCITENPKALSKQSAVSNSPCRGTTLLTYRLAIACTGEYAGAVGGGLAGPTHAAIVTSVNRINGVYEVEVAIRLILIANNNLIEYLNGNTDPYVNSISSELLDTNQKNIDKVIGNTNYDIGHVFTSDNNGLAELGSVCRFDSKARGATGSPNLIGDGFDIDYVAHEIGHQFGAIHTFNTANCGSPGGSYEPGGGTTIQAYAGICSAAENIQPNSDAIFHASSFDDISNFVNTDGSCGVSTPTGNILPVIAPLANNNISIPINTPFTLEGSATDANGDAITYNWEGWDIGPADFSWVDAATSTTRPLFRTRVSKVTGTRTFPDIRVIAANYPGVGASSAMDGLRGEVLPKVPRTMKFRLTVRDNRSGGGGVVSSGNGCQDATVFTVNAVGVTPFSVSLPNGGESFTTGSLQTVTWNTAATSDAPFNVDYVKILYSTDGGLTYPITILANTENDGTEAIVIPKVVTNKGRIKVEAIGNIFFDISDNNFTVITSSNVFEFTNNAPIILNCPIGNITITIPTTITGMFSTPIVLTASGVPASTTLTFASNTIAPGTSTLATLNNASTLGAGTYNITIIGTAGSLIKATLLTFIVPESNAIISNPTNQVVCAGASATFTANVIGNAVTFQWQSSLSATGPWASVVGGTGANTNTYTTPISTLTTPTTYYRLCVKNTDCADNVNSTVAKLTVNNLAAITSQPMSLIVCSPNLASFTTAATGTGLVYQWQESTSAIPEFIDIAGANNATYNIPATTPNDDGNKYRLNIYSACSPIVPLISNEVLLTVNTPVAISENPLIQNGCAEIDVKYSITAAGTGLSYQWQVSKDNGITFDPIMGATTSLYEITNAPLQLNGNLYNVVVTGSCNSLTSTSAALNLSVKPTILLTAPTPSSINASLNQGLFANINTPNFVGTFNWTKNGTLIPNTLASTFILLPVDGIGKYAVSTIDALTGCVSTSNEIDMRSPDNIASGTLFTYPNPVSGIMQVRFNFLDIGTTGALLNIYDEKGTRVMSLPYKLSGTLGRMPVDMSKVQSGTYMVYLMDAFGKKLASTKVVKVQ
jgi:hypothetical protein